MTTTLADILQLGGGGLPPAELFDPRAYALLIPQVTYQLAMAAQEQHRPPDWNHCLQPVTLSGEPYWGIGADVLTTALPPHGLYQHTFSHLPRELAATVLVVPWAEFLALLPPPPPES